MKIGNRAQTSTTDLHLLLTEPSRYFFPWGKIQEIYKIKDYTILEVVDTHSKPGVSYHAYVKNEPIEAYFNSIDAALLMCIAHRVTGPRRHKLIEAAATLLAVPE